MLQSVVKVWCRLEILLVNNEQQSASQISERLAQYCRNIVTVSSAQTALRKLECHVFDAVISEIDLPDIDGWRLTRLIRSGIFKQNIHTPVVLVSRIWCEHIAITTARDYGVDFLVPMDAIDKLGSILTQLKQSTIAPFREQSRLLVIEDDEDIARLVKRVLSYRFSIDVASDGDSGLASWMQHRHQLILLDVMLPGRNSSDVLGTILQQNPSQAIVFMTAHSSVSLAESLMLQGAADYIEKPFRPDTLRQVCEIAIRREDYLISNQQFAQKIQSLNDSREQYRQLYESHQHLLNHLTIAIVEINEKGVIYYVNAAWEQLTGYSVRQCTGEALQRYVLDEFNSSNVGLTEILKQVLVSRTSELIETCLLIQSGSRRWVSVCVTPMTDIEGKQQRLSISIEDITSRKRALQELEYMANHDTLTGLYNRSVFDNAVRAVLQKVNSATHQHALLYLDLDHFKVINDTIGHHHGDIVLKDIARILQRCVSAKDMIARLGGDEYGILLCEHSYREAYHVAQTLIDVIQQYQYQLDGHVFELGCSIGISMIHTDEIPLEPEQYLMQADNALYVAKQRGRNKVHGFSPDDPEGELLKDSMIWMGRIRKAIQNNQLELYLQPIFQSSSGQIEYFEALIRLHMEGADGVIYPGSFIPSLERVGETTAIDYWVIEEAIRLLSKYPQLHLIGVNLSAHAFSNENLLPFIQHQLKLCQVEPARILFELTESASLSNIKSTELMVHQLQLMGCHFAIDDFGSGFSTFSYLKQLPADYIKIDGSFVLNMVHSPVDQAMIRSITEVVRALGKQTVAEFVENESTLKLLRQIGVDCVQGFHVGKPGPVREVLIKHAK